MNRAAALAALVLLGGCASSVPDPGAVDWSRYPTGTYRRIDDARRAGDCAELLALSDIAKDSHYKDFIEDTLTTAGCYD
jgi:hypothetical protein